MVRNTPISYISTVKRQINKSDLSIIILAANSGYRMKSYGPKSLLNINERDSLLEYQINSIKLAFPKSDIVLVVGFSADRMIKRCPDGVRIIENQLFEQTNEVEQVRLALNNIISKDVIIVKDDIIFNQNILLQIDRNHSCIIYDSKNDIDEDNVGVRVIDDLATIFTYDISTKWCHIIHLIEKDAIKLKTLCSNRDRSKLYLFEILNILLEKSLNIKAIPTNNEKIFKIDTIKDLGKISKVHK